MTVYNFNLGIGWASSGIEYAQAYRAKLFRKINQTTKFIFTDLILDENIAHLTKNIGFEDDEIIWLYQYFTDIKIAPTTYTLTDVEQSMDLPYTRMEREGTIVRYFFDTVDRFMTCYLVNELEDRVFRVEHVSRNMLIRKDYFTYTRLLSEYFTPRDNIAYLYERRYFNEDGTVAYSEFLDNNTRLFKFKDRIYNHVDGLIAYMMEKLQLTQSDIIMIDRSTGLAQTILENKQNAKVGVVVHAEHFSENLMTDTTVLWNNFYDYQFTNASHIDFFVVATDVQNKLLKMQFKKYMGISPVIYTIPVGSLDNLQIPENQRKKFSLVTASRLASEKHVDWLIKSVVQVKRVLPHITFDIYGSGGEYDKLKQIIDESKAGDYITLKGHQKMDTIYEQYELYLSASTSEGFGLTLLEAIGSGLPIIGFDVRYGNQTFVTPHQNGYLIPYQEGDEQHMLSRFVESIVAIYQDNRLQNFREKSYETARHFLTDEVSNRWRFCLQEVSERD